MLSHEMPLEMRQRSFISKYPRLYTRYPFIQLVAIEVDLLRGGSANATVLTHQQDTNGPGAGNRAKSKASRCTKSNSVSGRVALGPKVGTVDVTNLRQN